MPSIRFYPLDIAYKAVEDRPAIFMFGRTEDNKQICVTDETLTPYFYVVAKKPDEVKGKLGKLNLKKDGETYRTTKVETVKRRSIGDNVNALKVYTNLPRDIAVLREVVKDWNSVKSVNEYDIPFTKRYIIDKGIVPLSLHEVDGDFMPGRGKVQVFKAQKIKPFPDEALKRPRILAFDIETYAPGKVISDKNPVIMVSFYGEGFEKVITWKRFKTSLAVDFVDGEPSLIERFREVIEQYKPDILCGYYSDGFDLPYLQSRAKKYRIRLDLGLDGSELSLGRGKNVKAEIRGIVHLDVFRFIKNVVAPSLETDTLDLDSVAFELLGERKEEADINELSGVWDKKPEQLEKFCRYNLQDAALTFKLAEKLLPNMMELVRIVGMPLYDVSRMGFSQLVESYLLKKAYELGEIAPEKPHHEEIGIRRQQTYTGGFVYEPKAGVYKDIAVFDYRSLYPSIISAHNISLETLNCGCCSSNKAAVVPTEDSKKYWFCAKKRGFLATVIEELITKRTRLKEIIKEKSSPLLIAREHSLKILANAFYGYLGFFGARWYSLECAKSITAFGRYYIHGVIDKAKALGWNVIYSDTDSVFLTLNGKKKKDIEKFRGTINKELPRLMELEYEGFYPAGIFVATKGAYAGAKKKYSLLREDGTLKIRGFETVRRNWSLIGKEVQEEVLRIILKENNVDKAVGFVRKVLEDLQGKKIPLKEVIIYTQLQKELETYATKGPHVVVAEKMRKKGYSVIPGTLIKYVVTEGEGRIGQRAKLPEDVSPSEYDANYYINNQIIPSVERIFNVFSYNKEYLLQSKGQKKLEKFFG